MPTCHTWARAAARAATSRVCRQAACAIGWLAGTIVWAAEPVPPQLTLAAAQSIALNRNADLRLAETAVAAAAAQVRVAREFSNPTLGLSVSGIHTDRTGNGTPAGNRFLDRSYDSILSLSQLLEVGKRGPRQESALAGRRQAEALRDDARRLLLQSVTQAYLAAVEAREEVRVLSDSAASLRREAEVAATRLRAGDISAADKAQIELAAARFELDADAARQTATAATIAVETLLQIPEPSGRTEFADPLPALATDAVGGLMNAVADPQRPDIAAAEAGVQKAEADLKLQQRGRLPDVTVSGQFEHNPPDAPNTAGIGVSLPLPLWNHNSGGIHAARAAREQAQAQLDKVRVQAAATVATARAAYREARARALRYTSELLPKSADVVRTVTFAYEKGGASLLDLLSAQRNDNDVRLAGARAQADYASARAALAAALNRLAPAASGTTTP